MDFGESTENIPEIKIPGEGKWIGIILLILANLCIVLFILYVCCKIKNSSKDRMEYDEMEENDYTYEVSFNPGIKEDEEEEEEGVEVVVRVVVEKKPKKARQVHSKDKKSTKSKRPRKKHLSVRKSKLKNGKKKKIFKTWPDKKIRPQIYKEEEEEEEAEEEEEEEKEEEENELYDRIEDVVEKPRFSKKDLTEKNLVELRDRFITILDNAINKQRKKQEKIDKEDRAKIKWNSKWKEQGVNIEEEDYEIVSMMEKNLKEKEFIKEMEDKIGKIDELIQVLVQKRRKEGLIESHWKKKFEISKKFLDGLSDKKEKDEKSNNP